MGLMEASGRTHQPFRATWNWQQSCWGQHPFGWSRIPHHPRLQAKKSPLSRSGSLWEPCKRRQPQGGSPLLHPQLANATGRGPQGRRTGSALLNAGGTCRCPQATRCCGSRRCNLLQWRQSREPHPAPHALLLPGDLSSRLDAQVDPHYMHKMFHTSRLSA